jgi:hypothetical protein
VQSHPQKQPQKQQQQQQQQQQPAVLTTRPSQPPSDAAASPNPPADFSLNVPAVVETFTFPNSDSQSNSSASTLSDAEPSLPMNPDSEGLLDSSDQPEDFVETFFAPALEFDLDNEISAVQAAARQRLLGNGTSEDELLLTPVNIPMQPLQPATNYVWALAATAELVEEDEQPPITAAAAAAAAGRRLLTQLMGSRPAAAAPAAARPNNRAATRRPTPARKPAAPVKQPQLRAQQQQQQPVASRQNGKPSSTNAAVNAVPPPLYLVRGVLSFGGPIGPMGEEMDVAVEFDRELYEFVARAAASKPSGDGVVCGNC